MYCFCPTGTHQPPQQRNIKIKQEAKVALLWVRVQSMVLPKQLNLKWEILKIESLRKWNPPNLQINFS